MEELPPAAPKSPVELHRFPKVAVVRLGTLGGGALREGGWTETPLPGDGLGAGDAELLLGLSECREVVDWW